MNKLDARQIELFENKFKENKSKNPFSFKGHGKIGKNIAITISYIIIGIICFSFGIEQGKQNVITKLKQNSNFIKVSKDAKMVSIENKNAQQTVSEKSTSQKNINLIEPVEKESLPVIKQIPKEGNYTIQLATFSKSEYALAETKRLLKKGFEAFTLDTGKHVLVCWGKFPTKETAKSSQEMESLKEIYNDCFIRKL